MENKKFKLTKENLYIIYLIQQIVFINISTYKHMKDKNFNDELVQHEFELLCNSYLDLHESYASNKWIDWNSCYLDMDVLEQPFMNKYMIKSHDIIYYILIDLKKDYYNCVRIVIQANDRLFEPVPINIFNIQFESED